MPISIQLEDERRRMIATATGVVSLEQLVTFIRTQRVGARQAYALLFDMRVATVAFTGDEIRQLADEVGARHKRGERRAPVAIVTEGDLAFGLGRMYESLVESEGVNYIGVFRSLEEADAFLASS